MSQTPEVPVRDPPLPEPEPAPGAPPFSDEALLLTDARVPGRKPPALAPAPGELWVESVRTEAELAAVESACADLAEDAADANPFYEAWMLRAALREFGDRRRIEIALVWGPHPSRRKGERQLLGLFPLEWRGKGPFRVARLWQHPYCYLCTPLLREGAARAALSSFLDWLEPRTTLARFGEISGEGEFHRLLVGELYRRGWPSQVGDWYTRALLRTLASGEEFLERALPGKRRKELRRQRARLAEQGRLEVCELRDGEDLEPWLGVFLGLEAAGWKGREEVAVACRTADQRFFTAMTAEARRRGRLVMLGLRLDGRPIALKYNLLSGDGSFAVKITYDEAFARFSPGVLLELENVHHLHRLGSVRWMDSCAAPNRFMINHLWPDRREIHTVFFAPKGRLRPLVLALVPVARWARELFRRVPRSDEDV